jgi:hypothetical protein
VGFVEAEKGITQDATTYGPSICDRFELETVFETGDTMGTGY